ncbi:hypothetical protein ACQP1W_04050 [Spirillospora sp. CA-255316]
MTVPNPESPKTLKDRRDDQALMIDPTVTAANAAAAAMDVAFAFTEFAFNESDRPPGGAESETAREATP